MSEPDVIARLRPLTNDWLRSDNYGDHFTVRGILEAYDSATQRAEAAEAERDSARVNLEFWKDTARSMEQARDTFRTERDALRKVVSTMEAIAREAYAHWDKDEDSKVGKYLGALGGATGIRVDLDKARAALDAALAVQPTTEGL